MPDLKNHWFAEKLAYLGRSLSKDTVWRRKASDTFPSLRSDPKAEGQRKLWGEAPFVRECHKALRNRPGSSDLFQPGKKLYQELLVGPLQSYSWIGSAGRWRKFARIEIERLVVCTERVTPFRLELQSRLRRHAQLSSLRQ